MPFVALLIGLLLIVVAYNNSFGALASELETDIPQYFKWMVAIVAILALGYIPGLRTPSRWLLGLVALVVVLTQWSNIQSGFSAFTSSGGATTTTGAAQPSPTASYTATYAPAAATTTATTAASATTTMTAAQNLAANPLNPAAYVQLAQGFGGIA